MGLWLGRFVVVAWTWMLVGCAWTSAPGAAAAPCTVSRDGGGAVVIRCPDGSSEEVPVSPAGAPGRDGRDGTSCTVASKPDGTRQIQCEDGTAVTVSDGAAGPAGGSCTVQDNGNGTKTISCQDGTSVLVTDGQDGQPGTPGSGCTATRDADAGVTTVSCDDGTSAIIHDGQSGAQGPAGQPGQDGTSCTVIHDGGVSFIACADGTSAVVPGASAANDAGATVTLEPPGPNCIHGGVAITSGTTTRYVCNVSPASVLSVVTAAAAAASYRDAVLGGTVTLTGSDVVLGRGVCFGSSPGVTLSSTCVAVSGATGDFSLSISGLVPGTSYYARAFATSASGTALGNEVSFQTLQLVVPSVTTDAPLNASRTSVRLGGDVLEWGGSPVLARGVCWSTSPFPTLADSKVLAGADVGTFTADATGLTPGTTYYARAFATNAQGTGYGQEVSFATTALPLAILTTSTPTAVSYRTASASGIITSDEGSPVTARGVCYAMHANPTRADSSIFEGAGIGTISASLTGLLPSTTYYVRAWAENAAGTAYGNVQAFTTLSLTTPTLTTTAAGGISNTTANSGGNITDDGGTSVTARGVCYSTAPLPTLAGSCTSNGAGAGTFSSLMGGLSPNTTYYSRAYATNSNGTAYGNQVSFTTSNTVPLAGVPAVGTGMTVALLTGGTASASGYVSIDGGASVTARGVCWSLSANPTLADNCTSAGNGLGSFTATLAGLSGCNVTVHARAYATNANGTAYGNDVAFTTGSLPTLTTDPVSNVTLTTADASGAVTDDGGCAVTERGFVYSGRPTPTTADFVVKVGSGAGSFSAAFADLLSNRTIYARSYAINLKGTAYGPSRSFVTLVPPGLYLGQSYAGGIIFHLDASGQHGIALATSAVGQSQDNNRASMDGWCGCAGMGSATSSAIGAGPNNSAAVVANCTPNPDARLANWCGNPIAEHACDAATISGYTDWYLPSADEFTNGRKFALFAAAGLETDPVYALSTWDTAGATALPRSYDPRTATTTHAKNYRWALFVCARSF